MVYAVFYKSKRARTYRCKSFRTIAEATIFARRKKANDFYVNLVSGATGKSLKF